MKNTARLYRDLQQKNPRALAYFKLLKKRYEQGKQAEAILNALKAIHEEQPALSAGFPPQAPCVYGSPVVGALPGGYLTPNGRVLTQQAVSQLVAACYAAAR